MKTFEKIRFSNLKNMKIIYAHNENHLNFKYHFMKENSRKKWKKLKLKFRVAKKDLLQPKDVLNVINAPYIMFYFTCTYYYGSDKGSNLTIDQ
jgi:hypothetical protein